VAAQRARRSDTDADYRVVERPHARPWWVVYENQGFIIYDLRGVK